MTDEQADGRGILGKDFLGGRDPVDVVREMRDAEPATAEEVAEAAAVSEHIRGYAHAGPLPPDGGYVLTSSEEEALEVVRRINEEGRNGAPVKFEADENDMATLTFGPMPMDDLLEMLEYLGTPEGSAGFLGSLAGALTGRNAKGQ